MTLKQALKGRATASFAAVAAAAMAAVSVATWMAGEAKVRALEAEVAELTRRADSATSLWRAQLAACHAAAETSRSLTQAGLDRGDGQDPAARLLSRQPEGIDVCARMESADEAVLSTLQ